MGKQIKKTVIKPVAPVPRKQDKSITANGNKRFSSKRVFVFILIAVSILVYANTRNNGYVLDDSAVIQQNTFVARGLEAIPTILSTPYHEGFVRNATNDTTATNDLYRPLSLVMFAAERQFFGETPEPGHIINIILFSVCVVLLFLFLDMLLSGKETWIAFIASMLFALHPVHTEVVANIKSADELLCFIFAFYTLVLFIKYVQSGKNYLLIAGAFSFFLSLLSKETSICFLGVIPLVVFFYINENKKRSIYLFLASLATAIIYLGIRFSVLRAYNADAAGHINFIDNELVGAPSIMSKMATIILIMGYYVKLLFIPYPLSCNYSFNTIPFVNFGNVWVWLSLVIYFSLAFFGVRRLIKNKKDPYAFGILFFLITIALFSNILFLIGTTMADRFLFFPSVGFCLVIALFLWKLFVKNDGSGQVFLKKSKIWYIVIPVFIIYAVLTVRRNPDWESNYTLFKADLNKYPQNAWLWSAQATVLTSIINQDGDSVEKKRIIQEGISDYQKSISIYPSLFKVHNQLGNVYQSTRKFDSAEAEMKVAMKLAPELPDPISDLGSVFYAEKKYPEAIEYFKKALVINPRYVGILNNLAISYYKNNEFDSSILTSKKALQIDPENNLAKQVLSLGYQALKTDSLRNN